MMRIRALSVFKREGTMLVDGSSGIHDVDQVHTSSPEPYRLKTGGGGELTGGGGGGGDVALLTRLGSACGPSLGPGGVAMMLPAFGELAQGRPKLGHAGLGRVLMQVPGAHRWTLAPSRPPERGVIQRAPCTPHAIVCSRC